MLNAVVVYSVHHCGVDRLTVAVWQQVLLIIREGRIMARYSIKSNLPGGIVSEKGCMSRREAARRFTVAVNHLSNTKGYPIDVTFRNMPGVDLRGTIQVDIDGFYYYVELYKEV